MSIELYEHNQTAYRAALDMLNTRGIQDFVEFNPKIILYPVYSILIATAPSSPESGFSNHYN